MEHDEKVKIFGRKIFFVNPPSKIEKRIVQDLRDLEYEVYIISDYKCAKTILRQNQDALCFIFLDTVLTHTQWYKFIKTFEYDNELKNVFIGLLSERISDDKKNFFLMNTQLPGGFTMTNISDDALLSKIRNILDVNEAKGKRQFIRLNCTKLKQITSLVEINGKFFPLELSDISSVGFAVNIPATLSSVFIPKAEIHNISITINNDIFRITGVVLISKPAGNMITSVMFIKNPSGHFVRTIKKFIFSVLDSIMSDEIKLCLKDETDYNKLDLKKFESYGTISDTDDTNNIEDAESVEELEEV